jgi:hypothetical protein
MAITAVSANSFARSQCALPFIQIEIVKGRQLVLFYSTYNCGNALPHPCLHEFNRVRLLKTFGSRSEKNASTQIPPRNRKNAAITLGFRSSTPRHRPRRFRQRFDSTGQFTIRAQFILP